MENKEKEKKVKVDLFRHKKIIAITVTVVVLVSLEIYAQIYVQIHILPVVSEVDAQNFAWQEIGGSNSFYKLNNFTFLSNGCRWLLILETEKNSTVPTDQWAFINIFKIEQNGSFLVYGTDLQIIGVTVQYINAPEQGGIFPTVNTFDYNNYSVVRVIYDWFQQGTSGALFNLTVGVYQRTLIGIIPKGQVTIPLNTTLTLTPDYPT
jgi:hypothetical protein